MHRPIDEPEDFIVRFLRRIPPGAEILDLGCGSGRHSVFLARAGCRVLALDRSLERLESLRGLAVDEGLDIRTVESEVESMSLLPDRFDGIVNTLFLYRPLFPEFVRALCPGGVLFFRTFTTDHADVLGKDRPGRRFLLAPGELREAFPGLRVDYYDESIGGGRAMATLVASKPPHVTE